jgi:hypothetical protein
MTFIFNFYFSSGDTALRYLQHNRVPFRVFICRAVGRGGGGGEANYSLEGKAERLDF